MTHGLMVLLLSASLGQGPYPYNGGGESYDGGMITYPEVTPGAYGEPLAPFDTQDPWRHAYFQEITPYRGHSVFLPYNYKHVLSQTQAAAGWGMNPNLAYSQQFWHRYEAQTNLGQGITENVPVESYPPVLNVSQPVYPQHQQPVYPQYQQPVYPQQYQQPVYPQYQQPVPRR